MLFLKSTNKGLESIITTFYKSKSFYGKKKITKITLFPMIHFGDSSFYEKVTKKAMKLDAVLYENFDSENSNENFFMSTISGKKSNKYDFSLPELCVYVMDIYYSTFSRVFGLTEQTIEQINYSEIKNFYNADLCSSNQKIDKKYSVNGKIYDGRKIFYDFMGTVLNRVAFLNYLDLIYNNYSEPLRDIYNKTINELVKNSNSEIFSFSKARENHVLSLLNKLIKENRNIGIIYGAEHMNSFYNYLRSKNYKVLNKTPIIVLPKVPPIAKHKFRNINKS
ncbi:MAG: hypothetical protein KatS3mg002_0147 [Candidatus Woesearchaeota archaeon]|nr:MAG: hypothetical protein KatS3mg002_0147 [Candidatus Woesearchaeota archaeon]